eukprot:COSAG02_NODE_48501_length_333_cov_0.880342_1_plen_79_part_01
MISRNLVLVLLAFGAVQAPTRAAATDQIASAARRFSGAVDRVADWPQRGDSRRHAGLFCTFTNSLGGHCRPLDQQYNVS